MAQLRRHAHLEPGDPAAVIGVRRPVPVLAPFISHYAGFSVDGLTPGTDVGQPSRHVHLIISLGEPIEILRMPNAFQRAGFMTALVSGLQDAPAVVRRRSSWKGIHVFLKPFGVQALLRASGLELSSRVFDLWDVWGRQAPRLVEQLRDAHTWEARFGILDTVFARALRPGRRPPALAWAWRTLAASHGRCTIEALARGAGWSRPYFTERFRAEIGLTPKVAARIFRFERACRLIKDMRPRLADVAADCGFHDQAHMTREWHALTGSSPAVWIARELPFLQDYELSGGDDEC